MEAKIFIELKKLIKPNTLLWNNEIYFNVKSWRYDSEIAWNHVLHKLQQAVHSLN